MLLTCYYFCYAVLLFNKKCQIFCFILSKLYRKSMYNSVSMWGKFRFLEALHYCCCKHEYVGSKPPQILLSELFLLNPNKPTLAASSFVVPPFPIGRVDRIPISPTQLLLAFPNMMHCGDPLEHALSHYELHGLWSGSKFHALSPFIYWLYDMHV